jgi:hypothetical protein
MPEPVTKLELQKIATSIAGISDSEDFAERASAFIRSAQEFVDRTRELTELAERAWRAYQHIPYAAPDTPVKDKVVKGRARLLPRVKRIRAHLEALAKAEFMQYESSDHPLRTTKATSLKHREEVAFANLEEFRKGAGGELYTLSAITPCVSPPARFMVLDRLKDEQNLNSMGSPAGDVLPAPLTSTPRYLAWPIESTVVSGITLGPWFGVALINPPREGGAHVHPHWRASYNVWVFPKEGAKLADLGGTYYWHPHADSNGLVCFGQLGNELRKYIRNKSWGAVIDMVDAAMEAWNADSPYCQLIAFDPKAERVKWQCSCGRASQGRDPVATGSSGPTEFYSCETCASDTCSHCARPCLKCRIPTLCTECQRFVTADSRSGDGTVYPESRRWDGPFCQDCHDRFILKNPAFYSSEDAQDDEKKRLERIARREEESGEVRNTLRRFGRGVDDLIDAIAYGSEPVPGEAVPANPAPADGGGS